MLTIRQIENRLDPLVLQYIKDNSYVEEVIWGKPIKIGESPSGTKYKTSNKLVKKLDKDKYERLVREFYIENVQEKDIEKKNKQRKRPEKGKTITLQEFANTMFRDYFEHRQGEKFKNDKTGARGKIQMKSFVANFDIQTRTIEDKDVVKSVKALLKAMKRYKYFTPNFFISNKYFTKEVLALLGVIVLDFDLDDHKVVMTKNELRLFIKKKLKVEPAMIWDTPSKGNYAAAILIEKMAGTKKSVHYYEQVVKEMVYQLDNLADVAATTANHMFSFPQNNPAKGRTIRKYNEDVHSIDDFKWMLAERDERRKKESKVVNFTESSFKRVPAIDALFNGEIVAYRDNAAFTLALVMRWLKYSQDECENYMVGKWHPKVNSLEGFDHKFTVWEVKKCVRHAYNGRYRNFKSTWIEIVTGIECDVSGYFVYRSYEAKGIYVTDTEQRILEFFKKQHNGQFIGTSKEISEQTGVTSRSLSRHLNSLRDKNKIAYETALGRGAKTTYTLVEHQLEFDSILQFRQPPIEDEIEALNELDKEMELVLAMG